MNNCSGGDCLPPVLPAGEVGRVGSFLYAGLKINTLSLLQEHECVCTSHCALARQVLLQSALLWSQRSSLKYMIERGKKVGMISFLALWLMWLHQVPFGLSSYIYIAHFRLSYYSTPPLACVLQQKDGWNAPPVCKIVLFTTGTFHFVETRSIWGRERWDFY